MRTLARALLVIAFSASAFAQTPSGNVFFGYSYLNADASFTGRTSFNGWAGAVEGKLFPFVGIVGDFSEEYGHTALVPVLCPAAVPNCPPGPTRADQQIYNILFGPRVSVSVKGIRPFAHVLAGFSHLSEGGGLPSNTSFAVAVGGGADFRLMRFVAWRVQADLLHADYLQNSHVNARVSTGLVLRF